PTPPRRILGEDALSPELEAVILKALEKNREHRFASAHQMAEALRLTPEGRPSGSWPAVNAPQAAPVPVPIEDPPSLGLEIATQADPPVPSPLLVLETPTPLTVAVRPTGPARGA